LYFLPEPQGHGAFLPIDLLTGEFDFSSSTSKLRTKDEMDTPTPSTRSFNFVYSEAVSLIVTNRFLKSIILSNEFAGDYPYIGKIHTEI